MLVPDAAARYPMVCVDSAAETDTAGLLHAIEQGLDMNEAKEGKRVLFIGQEPSTVDFSDPALPKGLDAAKIHAGIAVGMKHLAERGFQPSLCLVNPDDTAAGEVARQLAAVRYDCVVIGGGLRLPPKSLRLFEVLINAVHKSAPGASIAFNTAPEDTAEAAARWLVEAP